MPYDWRGHKAIPEVQTDAFRSWRFVQRPGVWSGYGTCRIYCTGQYTFLTGDAGDCIIRKPADEPWFQSINLDYFEEKLEAIDRRAQWEVLDFESIRERFADRAFDELDELSNEVIDDLHEEDEDAGTAPPSVPRLAGFPGIAASIPPALRESSTVAKGFWRAGALRETNPSGAWLVEAWMGFLVAAELATKDDSAVLGPFAGELLKRWKEKCTIDEANADAYNDQGARSFLTPSAHYDLLELNPEEDRIQQMPEAIYDHLCHYGETDDLDRFFKPGDAILVYHALLREFSRQVNLPPCDRDAYW